MQTIEPSTKEKEIRQISSPEEYRKEIKRIYDEIPNSAKQILTGKNANKITSIMTFLHEIEAKYKFSQVENISHIDLEVICYLQRIVDIINDVKDNPKKLQNLLNTDFNPLFACKESIITRLSDIMKELQGNNGLNEVLYHAKETVVRDMVVNNIFEPNGVFQPTIEEQRICSWFHNAPGMRIHNIDSIMAIAGRAPHELQLAPKDVSLDPYTHNPSLPFIEIVIENGVPKEKTVSPAEAQLVVTTYLKYCLGQSVTQKSLINLVVTHIESFLPDVSSFAKNPEAYMTLTEQLQSLLGDKTGIALRNSLIDIDEDNGTITGYSKYRSEVIALHVEQSLRDKINLPLKRYSKFADFAVYTSNNITLQIDKMGKFSYNPDLSAQFLAKLGLPMYAMQYLQEILKQDNPQLTYANMWQGFYQIFTPGIQYDVLMQETSQILKEKCSNEEELQQLLEVFCNFKNPKLLQYLVLRNVFYTKQYLGDKLTTRHLKVLMDENIQQKILKLSSSYMNQLLQEYYKIWWGFCDLYAQDEQKFLAITEKKGFNNIMAIKRSQTFYQELLAVAPNLSLEQIKAFGYHDLQLFLEHISGENYKTLLSTAPKLSAHKLTALTGPYVTAMLYSINKVTFSAHFTYNMLLKTAVELSDEKVSILMNDAMLPFILDEMYEVGLLLIQQAKNIDEKKLATFIQYDVWSNFRQVSDGKDGYIALVERARNMSFEKIHLFLDKQGVSFAHQMPDLYNALVHEAENYNEQQISKLINAVVIAAQHKVTYQNLIKACPPFSLQICEKSVQMIEKLDFAIKNDKSAAVSNFINTSIALFLSRDPAVHPQSSLTSFVDDILTYTLSYRSKIYPEKTDPYVYTPRIRDIVHKFCDTITEDIKNNKFSKNDFAHYKNIAQTENTVFPVWINICLKNMYNTISEQSHISHIAHSK